MSIFKLSK